ncbi:MAG: 3-deoxy-D-manno-octulosonic acid transferase, partial [Pseudomonadales bacterium]|nr:3-deoxy-D-manno-octulosonic acid transferase [Pseudomonadales bacterium]
MARILYSLVFYVITPLVLARLLWRSIREPLYRATPGQRFGFCETIRNEGPVVWVHSVSAGETIAAVPLVKRLTAGGYTVVVTTMTPTGRERVRTLLGDTVHHYYAPWDLPGAVRRFVRRIDPALLVIIDTELWPNIIYYASRHGTRILLVNGRLSERSAGGYRKIPMITRPMLKAMTHVAVQSRAHGERFLALGLPDDRLSVAGSIKFDPEMPADLASRRISL